MQIRRATVVVLIVLGVAVIYAVLPWVKFLVSDTAELCRPPGQGVRRLLGPRAVSDPVGSAAGGRGRNPGHGVDSDQRIIDAARANQGVESS